MYMSFRRAFSFSANLPELAGTFVSFADLPSMPGNGVRFGLCGGLYLNLPGPVSYLPIFLPCRVMVFGLICAVGWVGGSRLSTIQSFIHPSTLP
jgi:hypothetical protein